MCYGLFGHEAKPIADPKAAFRRERDLPHPEAQQDADSPAAFRRSTPALLNGRARAEMQCRLS